MNNCIPLDCSLLLLMSNGQQTCTGQRPLNGAQLYFHIWIHRGIRISEVLQYSTCKLAILFPAIFLPNCMRAGFPGTSLAGADCIFLAFCRRSVPRGYSSAYSTLDTSDCASVRSDVAAQPVSLGATNLELGNRVLAKAAKVGAEERPLDIAAWCDQQATIAHCECM